MVAPEQDPHTRREALAALRQARGVLAVTFMRDQVILYPDHLPRGVFVFVAGSLRMDPVRGTRRGPWELTAKTRPFQAPCANRLDVRSDCKMTVSSAAEVLFVPKNTVLTEPEVQRLLELLG